MEESLVEHPLITFTSDFGLSEEWAGVVKGVIYSINPRAVVIDITHDIPPMDIGKGAFVLAAALPHMPVAIHLAVVDPGVGTSRGALVLEVRRGDILVGPDNGLLLPAACRLGGIRRCFFIDNPAFFRQPVHPTFHGRDVFGPVAAHLSLGIPLEKLGRHADAEGLVEPPWGEAKRGEGALYAQVVDVDRFGTLRLNALPEDLREMEVRKGDLLLVEVAEESFLAPYVNTFGDVERGKPLVFDDSSGFLGVALNGASLANQLGAKPGDVVILYASRFSPGEEARGWQ
jgi:S-adenosylmethionine hydrolase